MTERDRHRKRNCGRKMQRAQIAARAGFVIGVRAEIEDNETGIGFHVERAFSRKVGERVRDSQGNVYEVQPDMSVRKVGVVAGGA